MQALSANLSKPDLNVSCLFVKYWHYRVDETRDSDPFIPSNFRLKLEKIERKKASTKIREITDTLEAAAKLQFPPDPRNEVELSKKTRIVLGFPPTTITYRVLELSSQLPRDNLPKYG